MRLKRHFAPNLISAVTLWVLTALSALPGRAQTFTTLVNFSYTVGGGPLGAPVQGVDGALYGTTVRGGSGNGTIYRMSPHRALSVIHSFTDLDGALAGGLILVPQGALYGVASLNGVCCADGGTVFRITPAGTFTRLHSFTGADGAYPNGTLVLGFSGSLYGVTSLGGDFNYGTTFAITPDGAFTSLDSFSNANGSLPDAGLIQASNGLLYGPTNSGGFFGDGVIYSITSTGGLTDIASFQISDGSRIYGELLQASDGNFYGAACAGGGGSSNGTVFRVNREGVFKVLHNFDGNDGSCPEAALVEGTDGNFYGTTSGDGTDIHGTVFQITPAGALTTLHAFNLTDGGNIGGLMQATDGNFYGVAFEGGYYGYGTLFQISMGLGPFIRTVPYFGRTGTSITILGNNLAGTSSVTFNGVAAAFTVISATAIRATVPAGATNGKVQVVTPHGTLVSNTLFEVLPRSAAP